MKYPQLVSGRTVSGISGWLSRELDSHGLDGRVYARLVLSLLHGPARLNARDLLVENKQGNKRISVLEEDRLWLETHGDLWTSEQVKRYAAVECLKSASGENSGIESLVDELCVKLREIENEPSSSDKFFNESSDKSHDAVNDTQNDELCYDNPVELAHKYYAAFPALSDLKQEKSISLFPNTAETSVWLTNDSVKTRKQKLRKTQTYHWGKRHLEHRKESSSNKMWKETTDSEKKQFGKTSRGRQEIGKKSKNRVRNHLGEQWDTVWEFGKEELLREYINNQCNSKDEGYDTPIKCDEEKDLDEVCFNREWIIEYELNSQNMERPEAVVDEINMAKFEAKFNESVEALWNDDKQTDCSIDELNLPVDFQDLLSSPSDRMFEDVVDAKTNNPPGRSLKNSIWSDNFSEDLETECMSSEKSFYPKSRVGAASDEYKHQLELVRSCWDGSDMEVKDIKNQHNEFSSMPWHSFSKRDNNPAKPKWSDGLSQSFVNTQFQILNHSKHTSGFREVAPKTNTTDNFGPIQKPYEASSFNNFSLGTSTSSTDNIDDDLLTSPKTHFRPIKDEGYADGTTFAISSNIDHINYKLCEDGLLAVASDTQSKRYMIYKQPVGDHSPDSNFVIKFCVKQISKSCQTDEFMFDILRMSASTSSGDVCCCATRMSCSVHVKAEMTENDAFDKEIQRLGEYRQKWCTKCPPTTANNNNIWTNNWPPPNNTNKTTGTKDCVHDTDPLLHIWSSDSRDACDTCDTTISAGSNAVSDIHELKSELKKDGEEILSDLSYMQSLYIGSEWEDDDDEDISDKNVVVENETPFDVNKLISNFIKPPYQDLLKMATSSNGNNIKITQNEVVGGGKLDRKRRHSSTTRNPKDAQSSGECKKPNCKFSHEISSMPCQFWADNSCRPDGLCPYRHPASAFTRPLTR